MTTCRYVFGVCCIVMIAGCASFQPHNRDAFYKDLPDYDFTPYGQPVTKLQKECESGNAEECLKLGSLLKERGNNPAAAISYETGCAHDSAESCLKVGLIQDQGDYKAGYYTGYTALDHYQKACDLKLPFGCHRAAFASVNDPEAKAEFLKKACGLGDKSGCAGAIRTFESSMSPEDRCTFGDYNTCNELKNRKQDDLNNVLTGKNTGGIVDLREWEKKQGMTPMMWGLNQIFQEYAVFQNRDTFFRMGFSVAVKGLDPNRLTPNAALGGQTLCMRYLGDQQWTNQMGFPIQVKSYEAVACPTK